MDGRILQIKLAQEAKTWDLMVDRIEAYLRETKAEKQAKKQQLDAETEEADQQVIAEAEEEEQKKNPLEQIFKAYTEFKDNMGQKMRQTYQ
jgi:14-3-3 protein epsilon